MVTKTPSAKAPSAKGVPAPPARTRRQRTPIVIQMEAVECGAAALGILLAHHGRHVPLEELRVACGVSRDGSNAANVLKAGRRYGLTCKGFQMDTDGLAELALPVVVYWRFDHFIVLEGISRSKVHVNDPAVGHRSMTFDEFDSGFTGIVLTATPGPEFRTGGARFTPLRAIRERLPRLGSALPLVVLLGFVIAAVAMVVPVFGRVFIDQVLMSDGVVGPLAGAMLIAVALTGLAALVQQKVLNRAESAFSLGAGGSLVRQLLRLPMTFFNQRQSSDVANRISSIPVLAEFLTRNLASTMVDAVLIIVYGSLLTWYDPYLGAIAVLFAVLNVLILRWSARLRVGAAARQAAERARLFVSTYNAVRMIETIKASGDEDQYFRRLASLQAVVISGAQKFGQSMASILVLPAFLAAVNTALLVYIGQVRVTEGAVTVGVLVAMQALVAQLNRPVAELTTLAGRIQDMSADLNRLRDIEQYQLEPAEQNVRPSAWRGAVTLTDVSFGYSPLAPALIEKVDLDLVPGSRVALVGGSGSGKSTVGRLVVGLESPWSGSITVDGHHRSDVDPDAWADAVALVDQDMVFFRGSVRDNITLWDQTISDEEVIAALKAACIYDEIAARPGGLSSEVVDEGRNFSGGQRQRLEIARTLVRHPALIVMDEATSALDPATELQIDANLRIYGSTCLIIAHRLSTVRDCDQIIVMDAGRIVDRGTHDELLERGGPYAELVRNE